MAAITIIRFRRLGQNSESVDGVRVERWEVAFSEEELFRKLDGAIAEVVMPAKPWYVRLWRRFFPLRGIPMSLSATLVSVKDGVPLSESKKYWDEIPAGGEITHLICARCGGDNAVSNRFEPDGTLAQDSAGRVYFTCRQCGARYLLPVYQEKIE